MCVRRTTFSGTSYRVARLRIIFEIRKPQKSGPLAYVEWLELISPEPDKESGWLKYQKSSEAEVIPAENIVTGVGMMAVFGKSLLMERKEVYAKHSKFFLIGAVTDKFYDFF